MKLIRKLMQVSPSIFPQSLVNVLIAVSQEGAQEHDKMLKVALATLCELGKLFFPQFVLHYKLFTIVSL